MDRRREHEVASARRLVPTQLTAGRLLEFERGFEHLTPLQRARQVRRELGIGLVQYSIQLNRLLDDDASERIDPELVGRLRARRDHQRARRFGERLRP